MRTPILLALVLVFFSACAKRNPEERAMTPEDSLHAMHLSDDFHVELFAAQSFPRLCALRDAEAAPEGLCVLRCDWLAAGHRTTLPGYRTTRTRYLESDATRRRERRQILCVLERGHRRAGQGSVRDHFGLATRPGPTVPRS